MFAFLLVVQALVAALLVGVILVQKSEGGGLGMGGSPSGLMSARGAADFLTRSTTILATVFVLLSIALAAYATVSRGPHQIDDSLAVPANGPIGTGLLPSAAPAAADPLAAAAAAAGGNSAAPVPAPAPVAAAPAAPRESRPAPAPAEPKAAPSGAPAPAASTARTKAPAAAAGSNVPVTVSVAPPRVTPPTPTFAPTAPTVSGTTSPAGNGQ